jgi:hypothetical protein
MHSVTPSVSCASTEMTSGVVQSFGSLGYTLYGWDMSPGKNITTFELAPAGTLHLVTSVGDSSGGSVILDFNQCYNVTNYDYLILRVKAPTDATFRVGLREPKVADCKNTSTTSWAYSTNFGVTFDSTTTFNISIPIATFYDSTLYQISGITISYLYPSSSDFYFGFVGFAKLPCGTSQETVGSLIDASDVA